MLDNVMLLEFFRKRDYTCGKVLLAVTFLGE